LAFGREAGKRRKVSALEDELAVAHELLEEAAHLAQLKLVAFLKGLRVSEDDIDTAVCKFEMRVEDLSRQEIERIRVAHKQHLALVQN
jgi:hypothetical protein